MSRRLLSVNREPLRLVPAAVREIWTKQAAPYRCELCGSLQAKLEEVSGQSDVAKYRYRCANRLQCARRAKAGG